MPALLFGSIRDVATGRFVDTRSCILRQPGAAKIVMDAMRHFDGERYELDAACVMPNHAHALLCPIVPQTLSSVMHSWKSFTSKQLNRLFDRSGRIWEPESFDHLVRTGRSNDGFIRYIAENPANAGLPDWPWIHIAPQVRESQ